MRLYIYMYMYPDAWVLSLNFKNTETTKLPCFQNGSELRTILTWAYRQYKHSQDLAFECNTVFIPML